MDYSGKKVLVTGAGGFIGSHLVEALLQAGAEVTAFLRYTSLNSIGNLQFIPSKSMKYVDTVFSDIRDPRAVEDAVACKDVVFHLAALIGIPYSYRAPDSYVDVNIKGTMNVLNACRKNGIERLVITSTSEVYGTALTDTISEEHPLQAQSPYSASKIGADALARSYHDAFGVPVVTLRPFNCYGPRQSPRAVIPNIIGQVLTKKKILLGSLTPQRDFTFVDDTAMAFMRAGIMHGIDGMTFNAGSGESISIGELARAIVKMNGGKHKIVSSDVRKRPDKSEVMRLKADSRLAKKFLGWETSVPLVDGLSLTTRFLQRNEQFISTQYKV